MKRPSIRSSAEDDLYRGLPRFFAEIRRLSPRLKSTDIGGEPATLLVSRPRLSRFVRTFRTAFGKLQGGGRWIDVWDVAGLRNNELRNAAVLAWLFNPRESHGQGSRVLAAFLDLLQSRYGPRFPLRHADLAAYSVATESYPLGNVENRVDVLIDATRFVAVIEVKIDAPEGERQIERYLEMARAKAAAAGRHTYCVNYLSTSLRRHRNSHIVFATWDDVAQAITRVVGHDASSELASQVLMQFANHVQWFGRS